MPRPSICWSPNSDANSSRKMTGNMTVKKTAAGLRQKTFCS